MNIDKENKLLSSMRKYSEKDSVETLMNNYYSALAFEKKQARKKLISLCILSILIGFSAGFIIGFFTS